MVTGEQRAFQPAVSPRDRFSLTMIAGPNPGSLLMMPGGGEMVIGRGCDASQRIEDQGLSRKHVRIFRNGPGFWIQDLRSTNGTFVNGLQVPHNALLNDGDRIQLGRGVILRFQLHDALEQEATRRLYDNAVRDPRTRLFNRRFLDGRLEEEFAFAARHRSALSVILSDIDHFKSVNDNYGHPAGDEVLRRVARVMESTVRIEDVAARYGGEEFCVVARGIEAPGAMTLAGRLRKKIEALAVETGDQVLRVTSSFGVATFDHLHTFADPASLVQAADAALYFAKENGRNQCCHTSDPGVMPFR